MKYEGPPKPYESMLFARYLRVEGDIYITKPGAGPAFVTHKELAKTDGITDQIEKLKKEAPDDVDGGFVAFDSDRQSISVGDRSSTLEIPLSGRARVITVEVFESKSPGYTVENNP